jgi:hypothetical protein
MQRRAGMYRLTPPRACATEWAIIKVPTAVIGIHLAALVAWVSVWMTRG